MTADRPADSDPAEVLLHAFELHENAGIYPVVAYAPKLRDVALAALDAADFVVVPPETTCGR